MFKKSVISAFLIVFATVSNSVAATETITLTDANCYNSGHFVTDDLDSIVCDINQFGNLARAQRIVSARPELYQVILHEEQTALSGKVLQIIWNDEENQPDLRAQFAQVTFVVKAKIPRSK